MVEWEAVYIDAKGLRVPHESVEYILWMKGGYTHFYVGRAILVEVYRTTKQKQKKYKIPKVLGNSKYCSKKQGKQGLLA